MSYINSDDADNSSVRETFQTINHLAFQMKQIYEKLKRPDGIEAGRFFEEMQMVSDRLNRTLYMAEDAMKLAQAKQRVKEMDNSDKKLKAENEKLKNQIYNQHNKEKDILMAFKHMDGQRETRTIRGISTILDKLLIVYPQMTVSMLKVFITVCQYPGLSLSDYCGKTGMARSTVSRHLLHLGPKINKGKAKSNITDQEEAARKYDFLNRGHEIEERGDGYTKGLDLIRYGKSMDGVSNFYAPSEKGLSILKQIKENIYSSLHAMYEDNFLRAYGEDDVISRPEDPMANQLTK